MSSRAGRILDFLDAESEKRRGEILEAAAGGQIQSLQRKPDIFAPVLPTLRSRSVFTAAH